MADALVEVLRTGNHPAPERRRHALHRGRGMPASDQSGVSAEMRGREDVVGHDVSMVVRRTRGFHATVRGDATLLASDGRGGWFGTESAIRVPAAGILLDAALTGFLDVDGHLGVLGDHRRVVAGPRTGMTEPDAATARLVSRLRREPPSSPWNWLQHVFTWGGEHVLDELVAAGVARAVQIQRPSRPRMYGLMDLSPVATKTARDHVRLVYDDGMPPSAAAVATAALLRVQGVIEPVVLDGNRHRARRHLAAQVTDLPPLARAVLFTLRVHRPRQIAGRPSAQRSTGDRRR